jgi:ribonuclease PH
MNVVMRDPAQYVEVQGTGERGTFARARLGELLDLGEAGVAQLFLAQKQALGW